MAATFSWVEYTSTPGTAGASSVPTNLNMGSTNTVDLAPSTYPITAGDYSYSKWVTGMFTGSFTRVDNIKFYMSDSGTGYVTGEEIMCSVSTSGTYEPSSFNAPQSTQETYAEHTLPTSAASQNVGVGGSLSASITSSTAGSNETDYIVLQSSISATASAGSTQNKTFTLSYDEV